MINTELEQEMMILQTGNRRGAANKSRDILTSFQTVLTLETQ